jgi:hypothetical protein
MRSFAPFDLDAAITPLSEVNADVIGRVAAGTMGIEPCLKQFCDDERFRSIPDRMSLRACLAGRRISSANNVS